MKFVYYSNCVHWPRNDVHTPPWLCAMIDRATIISRKTFLSKVDRKELLEIEQFLGYASHHSKGLTMAGDDHVSYYRSLLLNQRVYYFRHSAIEYVFVEHQI